MTNQPYSHSGEKGNKMTEITVTIPNEEYYHKAQHGFHVDGYNGNDLHKGYQTSLRYAGYYDGSKHYRMFIKVFNAATGSSSWVKLKSPGESDQTAGKRPPSSS